MTTLAFACTFPVFNAQLGPSATFWIYAGVCGFGLASVLVRLPETKGKTLAEVASEVSGRRVCAENG